MKLISLLETFLSALAVAGKTEATTTAPHWQEESVDVAFKIPLTFSVGDKESYIERHIPVFPSYTEDDLKKALLKYLKILRHYYPEYQQEIDSLGSLDRETINDLQTLVSPSNSDTKRLKTPALKNVYSLFKAIGCLDLLDKTPLPTIVSSISHDVMGMYIPDTKEILLGSGPKASCDSQDQRLSKDCEDSLLHELMHHILRSNNIKLNNPQFRNEVKSDILSHMINWPKEKVDRAANVVLGLEKNSLSTEDANEEMLNYMMGFVDKGKDFATVFPETVANLKNTIQQYKPPQSSINAKWTGHVASRENRQRGAEL